MPERLLELYQGLKQVIQRVRPTEVAIEKVFVGASAQSALKLGQARGVAILASAEYNLEVLEYSPNQIKKAVVGRGHADKTQVMFMIKVILSLSEVPESDAADALAVAVCHSNLNLSSSKLER
jgi:crossover junction endodeoxyribonuclease RuvC